MLIAGLQRVGANGIGAFLAMKADGVVAALHGYEARIHGDLGQVAQAFQRELEQAVAARGERAENIGLLAQVIAPRARLLLDEPRAHQREQQPPRRRLVEAAVLDDVAQLGAALGLAPDQRQQAQGAVDALGS